jgi:hypothetical protein
MRCQACVGTADRPASSRAVGIEMHIGEANVGWLTMWASIPKADDPSPLRKAPLTATVGAAMLLISLYVRRILTASREPASQAASGAR